MPQNNYQGDSVSWQYKERFQVYFQQARVVILKMYCVIHCLTRRFGRIFSSRYLPNATGKLPSSNWYISSTKIFESIEIPRGKRAHFITGNTSILRGRAHFIITSSLGGAAESESLEILRGRSHPGGSSGSTSILRRGAAESESLEILRGRTHFIITSSLGGAAESESLEILRGRGHPCSGSCSGNPRCAVSLIPISLKNKKQ